MRRTLAALCILICALSCILGCSTPAVRTATPPATATAFPIASPKPPATPWIATPLPATPVVARGAPITDVSAAELAIYGLVEHPLREDWAALSADGLARVEAARDGGASRSYDGVRLSDLFARAVPTNLCTCATAVFYAGGGAIFEARLVDLYNYPDSVVTSTGATLDLVLPGLPAAYWLRDVRKIEMK